MKKLIVFIVLLSFALRPIYFVGNVLYYQLNIDYIIDTYCINKDEPELQCNGKCHLAKQLQLTEDTTSDDSVNYSLLYEAFYPVFFQSCNDINQNKSYDFRALKEWAYSSNLEHLYVHDCFQPPEDIV